MLRRWEFLDVVVMKFWTQPIRGWDTEVGIWKKSSWGEYMHSYAIADLVCKDKRGSRDVSGQDLLRQALVRVDVLSELHPIGISSRFRVTLIRGFN